MGNSVKSENVKSREDELLANLLKVARNANKRDLGGLHVSDVILITYCQHRVTSAYKRAIKVYDNDLKSGVSSSQLLNHASVTNAKKNGNKEERRKKEVAARREARKKAKDIREAERQEEAKKAKQEKFSESSDLVTDEESRLSSKAEGDSNG